MKELSIEEKAKRYDEALKVLHKYDGANIMFSQYLKEEMFPELKESEDENIRKEMLQIAKESEDSFYMAMTPGKRKHLIDWLEKQGKKIKPIEGFNTEFERQISHIIASTINKEYEYTEDSVKWVSNALLNYAKHEFEKQGEQKPADKIEPKFKVGDYIICRNGEDVLYQITDSIPTGYMIKGDDGIIHSVTFEQLVDCNATLCVIQNLKPADKIEPKFKVGDWVVNKFGDVWHIDSFDKKNYQVSNGDKYNYFPISKENEMHLWTIQDAKDGDVLVRDIYPSGPSIYIFKEFVPQTFTMKVHCSINNKGQFFYNHDVYYYSYDATLYPATKEQRDLLFQKMKEAGYEWDAEKKELKKMEQTPVWAEEDEKFFKTALWHISNSVSNGKSTYIHCDTTDWFKSLKDRL